MQIDGSALLHGDMTPRSRPEDILSETEIETARWSPPLQDALCVDIL